MVPDLQTSSRYAALAGSLGAVIAEEAARVKGYSLLAAADVRAVLDQEANKQLLGCDATGCLAELADALDADLVVASQLVESPDDGAPLLTLTLVNSRAVVVMNRTSDVWRGPEDRLRDVVRTATQRLLFEPEQRGTGAIIITGTPPEATVYVDGVDRTNDHRAGRIGGVDVGVHEINIEAPDKLPLTLPVVVVTGSDVVAEAALEDVPVPAVWLWTGGIAAAVVGAAATGLGLYLAGPGSVNLQTSTPGVGINNVETLRGKP